MTYRVPDVWRPLHLADLLTTDPHKVGVFYSRFKEKGTDLGEKRWHVELWMVV